MRKEAELHSERHLDLPEHLGELRARIIRSLLYVVVGAVVGWVFYGPFFDLLCAPMVRFLEQGHGVFLLTGVAEGFMIKVQVSALIGVIMGLPLVTLEAWGFVSPGLASHERRSARLVAPLSIALFAAGVATAYMLLPAAIKWLISQNPPQARFMPSVSGTVLFLMKMYLSFGLVFQMPVVLMFMGRVGLVDSRMLLTHWKHAAVGVAIVAAVVTPSNDAFTMLMMCLPMLVLYVLSIGLVRLGERTSRSRLQD